MYLPAFPALSASLGASEGAVQGTLAAFFLAFALGQGLLGPLSDRFGRRPPLLAGLALFVAASAACALAEAAGALAAARAAQGLGACSGMVIARAVVRDLYPPAEAARAFAALMLVTGVAPMLAPLVGGVLLARFGWESIFWCLAALGLAALLAAAIRLPETRPADAPRHGVAGAARAYAALLRDARFVRPALVGAAGMAGLFAYIAGSPFALIRLLGVPEAEYGLYFGANALGMVAMAQVGARLAGPLGGPARVLRAAAAGLALAGALLVAGSFATGTALGRWAVVVPLFLYVSALGAVLPNAAALAMAPFGRTAGTASALMGMGQFGAGAVAAVALGLVGGGSGSALPMALAVALGGAGALAAAWRLPDASPAPAAAAATAGPTQ